MKLFAKQIYISPLNKILIMHFFTLLGNILVKAEIHCINVAMNQTVWAFQKGPWMFIFWIMKLSTIAHPDAHWCVCMNAHCRQTSTARIPRAIASGLHIHGHTDKFTINLRTLHIDNFNLPRVMDYNSAYLRSRGHRFLRLLDGNISPRERASDWTLRYVLTEWFCIETQQNTAWKH